MNLSELTQEVYNLTNRPDLVAETKTALKSATLKMHQVDFWDKDIFETGISFLTSEYQQSFEYLTLIPQWRALKYIRRTDVSNGARTGIKIITPDQILDSYSAERTDVAYLAGSVVQIKSCVAFQYILLGVYLNPVVTDSGFSSWIANEIPYAIVFEACRIIFKAVGMDAESAAYERLVAEQVTLIRTANILAVGS